MKVLEAILSSKSKIPGSFRFLCFMLKYYASKRFPGKPDSLYSHIILKKLIYFYLFIR